jgi:hypothetical protein
LSFCKNRDLTLNTFHFYQKGSYIKNEKGEKVLFENVAFDDVKRSFEGTINYEEQGLVCDYTLYFDEGFFKAVEPSKMVMKMEDGTVLNTESKDILLYERSNP